MLQQNGWRENIRHVEIPIYTNFHGDRLIGVEVDALQRHLVASYSKRDSAKIFEVTKFTHPFNLCQRWQVTPPPLKKKRFGIRLVYVAPA